MDITTAAPARGPFIKLGRIAQWIVFVFFALLALALLIDLRKLDAPDAPVMLFYATIVALTLLAIAHCPVVFSRLPRKGRWAAYGLILPVFALFGAYAGSMQEAWSKTPEGAKEAAERAEDQRQAEAAAAKEAQRRKAVEDAKANEAAAAKEADIASKKVAACEALVSQVVDGEKVIEINNVRPEPSTEPNEVLTCSGDAITAQGNVPIEFGLVQTPQGKSLVATRFP